MVKNGGFYIYRTERILTHYVNCHWSDSFLSSGYTMRCSKSYFAAGFTLGGYEADLFPAEIPGIFVALNVGFDLILRETKILHYFRVRECQVLYAECFK